MTDIVEQGRSYIRAEAPDYYEKTVVWKMADEIERLREALQQVACICWPTPGCSHGVDCKEYIARSALEEKSDG